VLFYGPVDAIAFILGKYTQQLLTFGVVLLFGLVNFFLISLFTNLGFSIKFIWLLVLSIFLASSMVSFGIFLSAVAKRTVGAVVLFISLVVFFALFWGAHSAIMAMSGLKLTTFLVYTRLILDNLNNIIQWISPFAYFLRGLIAVELGSATQYLISICSSLIYSAVLLGLAIYMFERGGVKR